MARIRAEEVNGEGQCPDLQGVAVEWSFHTPDLGAIHAE